MRRGQAALEFLTTYGWALLVILVMVGAIAYFGILKPDTLLPERCQVSPGFTCEDYIIMSSFQVIEFRLKQNFEQTIYFNGSQCTYEGASPSLRMPGSASLPDAPYNTWSPRTSIIIRCPVPVANLPLSAHRGNKLKIAYNISYQTSASGYPHIARGEMYAVVQ